MMEKIKEIWSSLITNFDLKNLAPKMPSVNVDAIKIVRKSMDIDKEVGYVLATKLMNFDFKNHRLAEIKISAE